MEFRENYAPTVGIIEGRVGHCPFSIGRGGGGGGGRILGKCAVLQLISWQTLLLSDSECDEEYMTTEWCDAIFNALVLGLNT